MLFSIAAAVRLVVVTRAASPAAIQRTKKWEPVPDPEVAGLNDRLTSFQTTRFGVPITTRVLNENVGPRRRVTGGYQPIGGSPPTSMPVGGSLRRIVQQKPERTNEEK